LVIWSLGLWFYATFYNFYAGQTDIFIALLVACGLHCFYYRGSSGKAGSLIALAALLKVTPAIFLVLWLMQRRWRSLAGAAIVTGVSVLGSAGFVSLHTYVRYLFGTLRQVGNFNGQSGAPFNGSIKGIVLATRFRDFASPVGWIVAALAFGVTLWYCNRIQTEATDRRLTVAVVASLLIFASPLIEPHTWILEFLPLALITGYWIERFPQAKWQQA
jgi:alpha-1,2-mannosyltransferase